MWSHQQWYYGSAVWNTRILVNVHGGMAIIRFCYAHQTRASAGIFRNIIAQLPRIILGRSWNAGSVLSSIITRSLSSSAKPRDTRRSYVDFAHIQNMAISRSSNRWLCTGTFGAVIDFQLVYGDNRCLPRWIYYSRSSRPLLPERPSCQDVPFQPERKVILEPLDPWKRMQQRLASRQRHHLITFHFFPEQIRNVYTTATSWLRAFIGHSPIFYVRQHSNNVYHSAPARNWSQVSSYRYD